MPTNPKDPIVWDAAMLKQAIEDEDFEPPRGADRYVKEARQWETKEKVTGKSRKKGGKGGKRGPFYWGPHDQLDCEGAISFEDAYDSDQNPIDEDGIRRYLVMDVFKTPCTRCTILKKPCFFAGGEPSPLGVRGIDEQELNKACAPCKESRHKCPGHSRLRKRTIIDNPFHEDGAYYKEAKKVAPKVAAPKATAPKVVAPKVAAPKVAASKVAAPSAETAAAAKVAGPSKPIAQVKPVKGNVSKFSMPDVPSQCPMVDSTPLESMPKPKPRPLAKPIASSSSSLPTDIGKFLPTKSSRLTDRLLSSNGGPHRSTRKTDRVDLKLCAHCQW